jgi:uncharacterized membrane protein YgcG
MTVPHPFRRAAALAAAWALVVLGLVALVTSQSQPARAASVGEFTMTPGSGKLTDPQPIAGSVGLPGACPDATVEDMNWNSVLAMYVVKPDGTESPAVMNGITDHAPYTGATSTVSLAAVDNPSLDVRSLSDVITGDGTYELRIRCVDNFDWAVAPAGIVPGDPYWSQKITVTGNQWVVGEGATATNVALSADPLVAAPDDTVKLTATLSPAEATGTVTFLEGDTTLGQATVSGGKAELTTTLAEGTHDIVAKFAPSSTAEWGASESSPVSVVVQLPRIEMYDNASGALLAENPQLKRGQSVKVLFRGCVPGTAYTMTMSHNDASFPSATADASGTATWPTLTVPEDGVAGQNYWENNPSCDGGKNAQKTVRFTLAEPSSESPSATPTDGSSDDPTDEPTDGSSTEPTDGSSGDTSGTTSGSTGGDSTSGGGSSTGGSSGTGGNLASTGSQIALFSGVGAVVLTGAGIAFVRYGRRNGLLTFGEPRA